MCIVIDMCALSPVFNEKDKNHSKFKPVFEWIIKGKGQIVYGGSTYKDELREANRYDRAYFKILEKNGKLKLVDDAKVDIAEHKIQKIAKKNGIKFNDHHIVAIIVVSKCLLVCTTNVNHVKQIRDPEFYPRNIERPKIYSRKENKNLLVDKYIADICKPKVRGTRRLMNLFGI